MKNYLPKRVCRFVASLTCLSALAFVSALGLGAVPPAQAADLGGAVEQGQAFPGPRGPIFFNGVYWGLSAGYGWGQSEHNYDRNDDHGLATADLDGGLAALTLGYNWLTGSNLLFGVEADIGLMDLSTDDQIIFDGHLWKSQFGPFWGTVRGRIGYLWGQTLLYATGGLAFMGVNEVGYGDADGQTAENRDFRSGWTVGGGIEHAFSSRVSAKLEYLHMDFGRYDGLSENQETFYFDNTVDIVRVGFNVKF